MSKEELICPWCGKSYFPKRFWDTPYCSKDCKIRSCREKEESEKECSEWAKRLHDGARQQSDDFGQQDGDNSVTFQ